MKLHLPGRARRVPSRPRRRVIAAGLLAVVVLATAAACGPVPPENPPYWLPGTTVDATNVGPLVHISWDATQGGDPVDAYQINLTSSSGPVVALVPKTVRACYISGLSASTSYTIVVTARDAQMHWSAPLSGTQGNRTTTITTSSHGGGGTNLWCHADVDTDGDGLPNGVETNDGTYTGAGDTGTSPTVADTDNDGLPDGEEALGTGGLNLRAMGARPTHQDLFLETDWISNTTCSGNGARPTTTAINLLTTAYANAPHPNPDGTTGIKLITDYGQGGLFTGGNVVAYQGSIHNANSPEFRAIKTANTDPARLGVFHYAIVHGRTSAGGTGELAGNDIELGVGCNGTNHWRDASHIMHELGHNFGLEHDGTHYPLRTPNNLPNYNSVMNYRYLDSGVDTNCDGVGDGVLDYSHGTNADLDESDLWEGRGICNSVDIDWNQNGNATDQAITYDINDDDSINIIYADGATPLRDYNDWHHVQASSYSGLKCTRICTQSQD